jgi:hypothetical protein
LFFVCGGPLHWATMARWSSAIPQSGRGGFNIGLQPDALPACASVTALAGIASLSRLPGKAIPESASASEKCDRSTGRSRRPGAADAGKVVPAIRV